MARKTPPEFSVFIERLVFGGEALGHYDGRPVFVFGALPNETVTVAPLKVSGKYIKARLVSVEIPSPYRRACYEEHYLTCSPWQTLLYEEQVKQKKITTQEMWRHAAGDVPELVDFLQPLDEIQYRNKLEFSVIENDSGDMQLAFHKRYRHNQYYAFDSCILGMSSLTKAATNVLKALQGHGWVAKNIKNILVRTATVSNKAIVVVYTTTEEPPSFLDSLPDVQAIGYVYSDPRSPAAVTTRVLKQFGDLTLIETINGVKLMYGYDSFFQIYPSAFTQVLLTIKKYLGNESLGTILDLYAGVGTIGLAFADVATQVKAIESHPMAQEFATKNAIQNNITSFEMISSPVENQHDLATHLTQADIVFVDPPRAGLNPNVAEQITTSGPERFVYISCNPATQCRDWKILQKRYMIEKWFLADMYPNTPHVESIIICSRI